MIKLYHGTNVKFGLLDPSKSRDGLDFGKGVYLTPDKEQAWGYGKAKANGVRMRIGLLLSFGTGI